MFEIFYLLIYNIYYILASQSDDVKSTDSLTNNIYTTIII